MFLHEMYLVDWYIKSVCCDMVIYIYLQTAVSLGIGIMSEEWVHKCWEQRNDHLVSALDEHLVCSFLSTVFLIKLICKKYH